MNEKVYSESEQAFLVSYSDQILLRTFKSYLRVLISLFIFSNIKIFFLIGSDVSEMFSNFS